LRIILFLRKFVASLVIHNKKNLSGLSEKATDGFFTVSLFEKISETSARGFWDYACPDLDHIEVACMVYKTQ
jgi:hypothetical protein